MADALLSAFLNQLATVIREMIQHEVKLVKGVDKELENLKKNLAAIKVVLKDAEKRQWQDEGIKLWMDELKEVSYDMDEVLDEWSTAILQSEIEKEETQVDQNIEKKTKVRFSILCRCFLSGPINQVLLRHDIAHKIEDLNGKLDNISSRKDRFHFNITTGTDEPRRPNFSTSILDVPRVYGQNKYKETVLNHLLRVSSQEEGELYIIPVVGMGGMGKTTLAKLVYNDEEVKRGFSVRAWVCVSEPFDRFEIAKAILKQLTGEEISTVEQETLMNKFLASIKDKKFLLVLDDVWTDDHQEWGPLENDLRSCAVGSRILVTTRKKEVAKMIGDTNMLFMKELSDEDSWKLFSEIAFFGKKVDESEDLKHIGEEIAHRCKGLPLALKTLGSLLRGKTQEEWQEVLQSDIWELEEGKLEKVKKNLLSPLLLSYYDLPSTEKRCFSYCAILPKDYMIGVDDLIQQWMAQGYFSSKKNMEVEGQKCFENLAMRSFFQDFVYDKLSESTTSCKMHDIVHDFAQFLTLNEFSTMAINNVQRGDSINARHFTLTYPSEAKIPVSVLDKKNLHSLILIGPSIDISPDRFSFLKYLRTLNLKGCNIRELPDTIGELIHLRYLNLSYNLLRELPNTIGNLCNLQTLILDFCGIQNVPSDSRGLPKGIRRLRNLQMFVNAYISRCSDKFQLPDLTKLRSIRDIIVCDLGAEEHLVEAAVLDDKNNLFTLTLHFDRWQGNIKTHETVLQALKPHPNLQRLSIENYIGGSIPDQWMITLINLKRLNLFFCRNCEMLPALGKLQSLETLELSYMTSVKKVGPEFLGLDQIDHDVDLSLTLFPKLKRIQFLGLFLWCEWFGISGWKVNSLVRIMPRLEYMEFIKVPKLESLPDFLQATPIKHLIIKGCPQLEECCQQDTGKEWDKIRHILKIEYLRDGD